MANQPFKIVENSQKQMPYNVEAEQAVIGSILVSNIWLKIYIKFEKRIGTFYNMLLQ